MNIKRILFCLSAMCFLSGCGITALPEESVNPVATTTEIALIDFNMSSATQADSLYQSYPVQDFQRAYADFLSYYENPRACIIHLDEDVTPELVLCGDDHNATIYSFDGTSVYEVGIIDLDYYFNDFSYRPYLGMMKHSIGSVINGEYHPVIDVFGRYEGRLVKLDTVHLASSEYPPKECEMEHITTYEQGIPYDVFGAEESWTKPSSVQWVSNLQMNYWMNH